jgi:hypothetical protein
MSSVLFPCIPHQGHGFLHDVDVWIEKVSHESGVQAQSCQSCGRQHYICFGFLDFCGSVQCCFVAISQGTGKSIYIVVVEELATNLYHG